ncbi:hypothetical protein [Bartonella sp. A05]|uniref:hypothetical protein n=1 Tax=Bartonella sp. A05 TaxID=2967261 RepID=UPI0022A8ECF5|nr:hypothetical protein [Bartonella sp. A05]MCZ2203728.1 hypothetical protein [Bartonella sp. A05]
MERRIHARRKNYSRKLYRKMIFICVILFCTFSFCFVAKEAINHFFFKKEVVQQVQVKPVIPTFDLRIYCTEIAALAMPNIMREVYQHCINSESDAYFAIRKIWEAIPDDVKERCVQIVRPGDGNYFLLRDCLMNAKQDELNQVRHHF